MDHARKAGECTNIDRIRLRKTTSDLHSEIMKTRKLQNVIKRLKTEHKREIAGLYDQLDAMREMEERQLVETSNASCQTDSTSFRDNHAMETVSFSHEEAKAPSAVMGSIFDEISRSLPDLTRCEPRGREDIVQPSFVNDRESFACESEGAIPVGEYTVMKAETSSNSEADEAEVSLLECKRVCSLISRRKPSAPQRVELHTNSQDELSDTDDYFTEAIEAGICRPQTSAEERQAIFQHDDARDNMHGSLWQRLSDTERIHVSQARLGIE